MKTTVKRHFDHFAKLDEKYKHINRYYYDYIKDFLARHVPKGKRVLDLGCGQGALLAHTEPSHGVGIDISERMVEYARHKFPDLQFKLQEIEKLPSRETFDYVLMIDILDHLPDIWDAFIGMENVVREGTVLCIATLNPLWQPIFGIAERLKLKMPSGQHSYMRAADIINLLEIFDYEVVRKEMGLLIPRKIPFLSNFVNYFASRIPGIRNLCAVQLLIARKNKTNSEHPYFCSVVVPCHNEESNVEECAMSIPQMGKGTEVIFVNDASTDGTLEKLGQIEKRYPHVKVVTYPENKGKGYAVRQGFEHASGDILMIFDADLTVPAADLHEFTIP